MEGNEPIVLSFSQPDFIEVQGHSASNLFKIAANDAIEKIQNSGDAQQAKNLSLKYQVLCNQTAIVGVMKQKDKVTGELQESTIKFSKTGHQDDDQIA